MSSNRKVAANRRNAQKSTGPRTLSGKTIASMNALKHGLCSRKPLIPGENEAEFTQFTEEWVEELRPAGARQRMLAADIILAAWQLLRVAQLRAGVITPATVTAEKFGRSHPMSFDMDDYAALAKLDRHHALLQRTVERGLKLLQELQAEEETADSADYADEPELQNEPTVSQPLCSPELGDASSGPSEWPDRTGPSSSRAA